MAYEKVSILIPAYNSEKWISETIESALNQTWRNIEVIVVDDGSIDNTNSILRGYERNNVKIIRQENMGVCIARNNALKNAQGTFIQWLDSDDVLDENKIKNQMTRYEKSAEKK